SPLQVGAAQATGQSFSSPPLPAPLSDGTYTAIARQASAIENGDGQSAPVTFTVDTAAPAVTLNPPFSPSANRRPSFSGTASDRTPVTVEIHSGPSAEGALVASVTAEASAGRWSSGRVEELPEWGQYTAVAVQPSPIHNPD